MKKEIVVIGGGILGASTAYHLAKLGAKVTLVDRMDKGQATDAAAGIVCPWLSQRRNKAWYRLVKGGARYYPELINQLEKDGETHTGYKRVGALSLHRDRQKLEQMAERAQKRKEDAPEIGEITILSPKETRQLFPPLSEEFGSVFVSGGARVNGRALRAALINASVKNGVSFRNGNASILVGENRVTGIKLENSEVIHADKVIDTTGSWSQELLQPIGIEFQVRPQKAQIIHIELPGVETGSWPVVMPPDNQYLLSIENGQMVVGSTHENDMGFDYRPTPGGISEILGKALQVAPGLSNGTFDEVRVGFRPFTPGFLPVIGPVPHYDGLFVANGLGSSGLTSGPFLGAQLANLVLGLEIEIDIKDYDVTGALKE